MSVLVVILAFVGTIVLLVARAVAVDEVKVIQRRISASLEAAIAALPDELQDEWAEEWRGELASIITMPLTAAQFVRGVRRCGRPAIRSRGRRHPRIGAIQPRQCCTLSLVSTASRGRWHRRRCRRRRRDRCCQYRCQCRRSRRR